MIRTIPLHSISNCSMPLSGLHFISVPPEIVPASPTATRDPRRPPKGGGVSEKGALYLAASFLDFEDRKFLVSGFPCLFAHVSC